MRNLASFVMRGPWQAALVTAGTGLLSLLIPPALIISGAGVALVTLRRGRRAGFVLTLLASLGLAALALPIFSTNGFALAGGAWLLFWLPMYVLAAVLRATVSLALTLQVAAALGFIAVLLFYVILGDPAAWWMAALSEIEPVLAESGLVTDPVVLRETLELLVPFMPGLVVANLLAYGLLALLLGRWWQSLLFNPGGFREEFHDLRLGQWLALLMLALFGLALGLELPVAANLTLVLAVVFALQGVAVLHGAVGRARLHRGWLIGFYVLMVFALPQLLMLLWVVGVVDTWVDARARIKPKTGTS